MYQIRIDKLSTMFRIRVTYDSTTIYQDIITAASRRAAMLQALSLAAGLGVKAPALVMV